MMNNKSSEQRMQYYSETFDFYMDSEDHPDFEPANDILGQYIQSVVADNPQLDSQNPLWTEILKDDLMRFLQALLSLYEPIEKEHDKQSKMIYAFTKANMNGKRKMWNVVSQTIKQFYAAQEVNIEGYINQMQQMDEESKSMVLSVLAKDWEKANDEYMERIEKEILDKNKNIWECSVRDHGIEDYERVRKIEHVFYRYPALTEIVKIIGREQPENKKEQDDILFKYKPLIVSNHMTFKEVEEIVESFKNKAEKIWLKRMGREDTELWYEEVDFSDTEILIIEWTHGNSDNYKGVDIPVLLNSTPQETMAQKSKKP